MRARRRARLAAAAAPGFAPPCLCYSPLNFRACSHVQRGETGLADQAAKRPFFVIFVRYWLPVLVYLTAILALSAQPQLKPPAAFHLTDKFYHASEYFGLGLFMARAFRAGRRGALPMLDTAMVLTLGIIVGAADEIFQSTVPGRSSDIFDLLADTTGVLLSQIILLLLARD